MHGKLPDNSIALFRSFLAFAESLNIVHTANELSISRLTLKNRLKALERLCNCKLFELDVHRRYKLTPRAEIWFQEIKSWMQRGEDLFLFSEEKVSGLIRSISSPDSEPFYSQQHPVSALWEHDTPYLQTMLADWVKAKGQCYNPAFSRVEKNSFLARLRGSEFIIVGIGKNAAIMDWLGREWCLSAIGKPLSSTAISTKADKIVTYAYRQVIMSGTPWYDHVSMEMPRPVHDTSERAYYRRLILPCKLPDGSPLVASIVELSDDLEIRNFEVPRSHQPSRES